jgi:chromosome segregation ATPase
LCQRVKELLAIRSSVRNELRQLESKRRLILEEITEFNNKLDLLKSQLNKKSTELERIHISLEQTKYAQKEVLMKSNALLVPPLQLLPQLPQINGLINFLIEIY